MKTIITNVIVVTMDVQRNVYTEGYVKIEGTKITEVGPAGSLKDTKEELERTGWEIRDGQRGILMPGMILKSLWPLSWIRPAFAGLRGRP